MPLREAQLIIRDASTVANPDGTTDLLVLSTRPTDAAPYLVDWPEADGQSIDPITGQLQVGAYTVLVADALTAGTDRVLTSLLHDASNRPQLLSRRVYLRTARDGGSWETRWAGYLLDLELVDAVTWRLQLGDSRRIEQSRRLWQQSSLDFPIRGALFGGPIIGGWMNGAAVDRGGWEFIVKQVVNGRVYAEFVAGYRAGGPRVTGYRAINEELKDIIDNAGGATLPYDLATQTWPARAVVQGYGTFQMCANDADTFFGYFLRRDTTVVQLGLVWPTSPPALNTVLRISGYAIQVQPASPLYFTEHPCDLLAKIWVQEGIAYDAAALAAVRASIGDRVRLSAKITEPPRMTDWLEQAIFGPFGIGVRPDTQGRAVAFRTRLRSSAVPTLQINPADCVDQDPVVFSLGEKSAIVRVSVRTKQYLPWQPLNGGTAPIDGVIEGDLSYEPGANPDASTFATREVTFDVPGMIHTADSTSPDARDLTQAIALEIYDRWGRGCPTGTLDVTLDAPAAAAQVGDEVYVALAQAPNANKRLGDEPSVGARIAQVVQRTERLDAVRLTLLDSGTAAQPVAPAPTLAIATSPTAPRAVAEVTITNAATINATGVLGVALEWAAGTASPVGAGADLARFAPGLIPTGAVATPASPAGSRIWVRARTEQQGRRPSAWSAWVDVTLTGLVAPAGLTAVLLADTLTARLAWNPASGTNRTEICLYQGSSAPGDWTAYVVAVLPVGASPVLDVPVLPGALPYQWRVRQLEPDGTPGAAATGVFTSLANLVPVSVDGSGTTTRLAKWASASTLGNAVLADDGTHVYPASDATTDLGIVGNRLRDIRASRDVYVGGTLALAGTGVTFGGLLGLGWSATDLSIGGVSAGSFTQVRIFTSDTERARFHTSGGISLLDATDPGAGVVRVGGHLRFPDATHDIGQSGANRPRDGWFSRDVTVGGTITTPFLQVTSELRVTTTRDVLFDEGSGNAYGAIFRQASTAGLVLANGVKFSGTAGGFASSTSANWGRAAVVVRGGDIMFFTAPTQTVAVGTDVAMAERMRLHPNGGLSLGGLADPGANSFAASRLLVDDSVGAVRLRNTAGVDASEDLGIYRSAGLWRFAGWATGAGFEVDTSSGAGHTRPTATATSDLGQSGARFRDGWFSRDLTVGGVVTLDSTNALRFGSTTGPALALSNSGASARIKVFGGTGDAGFIFQDATGASALGYLLGFVSDASMRLFASDGSSALEWRASGGQPSSSGGLDWGTAARQWRDGWFSRDLTVGGTISGNGSGLTALNASNLASGTVPSARVSGAYTGITSVGTLSTLTVSGLATVDRIAATSTTVDSTFPGGLTARGGRRVPEIEFGTSAPSAARPIGTLYIQTV